MLSMIKLAIIYLRYFFLLKVFLCLSLRIRLPFYQDLQWKVSMVFLFVFMKELDLNQQCDQKQSHLLDGLLKYLHHLQVLTCFFFTYSFNLAIVMYWFFSLIVNSLINTLLKKVPLFHYSCKRAQGFRIEKVVMEKG